MQFRLKEIGTIRTPYSNLEECPRNINIEQAECRLVVDADYHHGLLGLSPGSRILVLYWLHAASFDKLQRKSRRNSETRGIFALRTPHRPNPIGAAEVVIEKIEENTIIVRGLDCLDGTPLLDIKPAMS